MLTELDIYILIICVVFGVGFFLSLINEVDKDYDIVFTVMLVTVFLVMSVVCFRGIFEKYKVVSKNEKTYLTIHGGYRKDNIVLLLCIFSVGLVGFLSLWWDDIKDNTSLRDGLLGAFGAFYILFYIFFIYYLK